MALTTVNAKITFDLVTGYITGEDITDYAGQGITFPTWSASGYFKVEYYVGGVWTTIFNNLNVNPPTLTDSDFGPANIVLFPLVDDLPVPTRYRITYRVVAANGPTDVEVDQIQEFEYTFVKPEICITKSVNCAASTITSVDATDYEVAYATIVSAITRAHTIYPPPASDLSPLTANLVTLTYTGIVTTTWTAEVLSTVTYEQDDGLFIQVELSGTVEIAVTCDTRLSRILCCLNTIDQQLNSFLRGPHASQVKADNYANSVVKPTWHYITLFLAAQSAGNATKAATYYQNILDYSGCGDCTCSDPITTVTPENTNTTIYVVDSPDNSIQVIQEVVGDTTTFHIQVSPDILTIINNLGDAINVVSGSPEITVTPSGSNPKLFTITWTGGDLHTEQLIQKGLTVAVLGGVPYMSVTVSEINNVGPDVLPVPHTIEIGNVAVGTATATDLAQIKVSQFLDTGTFSYIAFATVMKRNSGNPAFKLAPSQFYVEVFHNDSPTTTGGELYLRFIDSTTGFPVANLGDLAGFLSGELYIALDIIVEP